MLLTLPASLLIVDVNVAVVDEPFEHHSGHMESMSSPVVEGLPNDCLLVLLVHYDLTPVSELLQHRVLHGSHEVVAKLPVALVAAQLLLSQDVVFLLAAMLLHGTDELITLFNSISLLILNARKLLLVRQTSVFAPHSNSSLSHEAVHSVEDHGPITMSTLVSLRVPDQAVEDALHQLGVGLVTQINHAVHILVMLPAPLEEVDIIVVRSAQLALPLPHDDLGELIFLRRANVADVHPATNADLKASLLELAHGLLEQTSFSRPNALLLEAQVTLLFMSQARVNLDLASESMVDCLPQLSLALQQLLAPEVKCPQQIVAVVPRDSTSARAPDGDLVVATFLHPFEHVRVNAPRKLILDGGAGANGVRLQDLLRLVVRELFEAGDGRVDLIVDCMRQKLVLTNLLVLTQRVKAVLHDVPLVGSHKLNS